MADFIVAAILLIIVGASIRYIVKAKKSGAKCIGCSVEGGCGCGCSDNISEVPSGCGCGCGAEESGSGRTL